MNAVAAYNSFYHLGLWRGVGVGGRIFCGSGNSSSVPLDEAVDQIYARYKKLLFLLPMFVQLVEGTEGEAFSAAFINPTSVSGALEDLPRPDSLESAPPLSSSSSGESDLSAQGLQNYPATDSGLVLEDTGNMAEAGTTVIQSQGDKGKESETREEEEEEVEDEDMELDESVIDDSEQEEVEYDSSVSLDY